MVLLFALLVTFSPAADAAPYDIPIDAAPRYPALDYEVPDPVSFELVPAPAPLVLDEMPADVPPPRHAQVTRPTVEADAALVVEVRTRES